MYSLPTHEYVDSSNEDQYSKRLRERNRTIQGFTKHEGKYYLVATEEFHRYHSQCGFCPVCGIFRNNPVYCSCSHSECPAIDRLVNSSTTSEGSQSDGPSLAWIFDVTELVEIEGSNNATLYYAAAPYYLQVLLLLVRNNEKCMQEFIDEFARIYTLPTHIYANSSDSRFRRYPAWLQHRNRMIKGFTKYGDNYYLVADEHFYHHYLHYGHCSVCGILRCSPVWCVCGHTECGPA